MNNSTTDSVCRTCAHWMVYPCKVGRIPQEAWRCTRGVTGAGERKECPLYLREIGSEAW